MHAIVPSRLIERKRDGAALSSGEWQAIIQGYVAETIPDYQMAALAMAVVFQGMAEEELAALTEAMLASGKRLDLTGIGKPVVDKHSIGGVGDKTSLLLAPMLAATGLAVPMISGRGLGHTGGTLDKLEAIPGMRTDLSLEEAVAQLRTLGVVMMGQTPEIVPADKRLYALRDVTGTVESIPLISASIMSKKLAEGLDALVLDIKTGSGAFITDPEQSLTLAKTMIAIGESHHCHTVALLTAMDRPLGHACGNALETEEAIMGLSGSGPSDLMEVTYALGVEMLIAAGAERDRPTAQHRLEQVVESGAAKTMLATLIDAQGGAAGVVEDPSLLPRAPRAVPYLAHRGGVVAEIAPRTIGHAIVELGGGRRTTEDEIDPSVGFVLTAKPGDSVHEGQTLGTIHAQDEEGVRIGVAALDEAITILDAGQATPLVTHRVTLEGVERLQC